MRQRCLSHGEEVARVRSLEALVDNITASYAIEGEAVDSEQLRSSLGRRLDVQVEGAVYAEPASEALAQLVHEVTGGAQAEGEVTVDTLHAWHRLLFPEGISGRFEGGGLFEVCAGKGGCSRWGTGRLTGAALSAPGRMTAGDAVWDE
ncbi:MAG: DUF4172 domain-containing protein [Deltaproteobacteria bacterium]|nr:MAG: DUF4172 domain-containing protein [Deltaproteobacteria bacterium]